jgi:hypothetical protein
MSYDYSYNELYNIIELKESMITIKNEFPDYKTLSAYKFLVIREWNKPLPELPNSIIAISFMEHCNYNLNNLPNSVEAIEFHYNITVSLDNLPQNLIYLAFYHLFVNSYKYLLNNLPESLQILYISNCLEEDFSNLPKKLKSLTIYTANLGISSYPPELEELNIKYLKNSKSFLESVSLHLELLPITIKRLYLPQNSSYCNIEEYPGLNNILERLINLEELDMSEFINIIPKAIFSSRLNTLYIGNNHKMLAHIPDSVKTLFITDYKIRKGKNSIITFADIIDSNIIHIHLDINDNTINIDDVTIDIVRVIPQKLQELTILETHPALYKFKTKYPNIKINKLPNYNYQEKINEDIQ